MNERAESPDISVIVTCYNEMPHLPRSVQEIEEVLNETVYTYELIFVDDCSTDTTRASVQKICAENPRYRYSFHEKNAGRGRSVRDGLALAKGRYAGFIDVDLEIPARYIPVLVGYLKKGYDMACVERIEKFSLQPKNLLRLVLSRGYQKISKIILPIRTPDSESGLKFFNMESMKDVIERTENDRWFWDTEIVITAEAAGKKIASVPAVLIRKPEKQSTVRLLPDAVAYFRALLQYRRQHSANMQHGGK